MHTIDQLADLIRPKVERAFAEKTYDDADQRYLHVTAVAVAKELAIEPTALHVAYLTDLLAEHVTPPSREYPKMLYHHDKELEHVVANAEEEAALGAGWHDRHWAAPAAA
jgi:hypothetical protein